MGKPLGGPELALMLTASIARKQDAVDAGVSTMDRVSHGGGGDHAMGRKWWGRGFLWGSGETEFSSSGRKAEAKHWYRRTQKELESTEHQFEFHVPCWEATSRSQAGSGLL